MKAVILAGGRGTRLSVDVGLGPKPMVEVGGSPMLVHVMRIYSAHGINEFVVCLGDKGYVIKEFFANYYLHHSDVTINLMTNEVEIHRAAGEPWHVTLVDTGGGTMTGGRIKRALAYVREEEEFCLAYGDAVADLDISALIATHRSLDVLATVAAVQPLGRSGALAVLGDKVTEYSEDEPAEGTWVNGGFFVLSPEVETYIAGDATTWEGEPLRRLASDGLLGCYRHTGFWHTMDTPRDLLYLDDLCSRGVPPWLSRGAPPEGSRS